LITILSRVIEMNETEKSDTSSEAPTKIGNLFTSTPKEESSPTSTTASSPIGRSAVVVAKETASEKRERGTKTEPNKPKHEESGTPIGRGMIDRAMEAYRNWRQGSSSGTSTESVETTDIPRNTMMALEAAPGSPANPDTPKARARIATAKESVDKWQKQAYENLSGPRI
jgi:hypothetical protein